MSKHLQQGDRVANFHGDIKVGTVIGKLRTGEEIIREDTDGLCDINKQYVPVWQRLATPAESRAEFRSAKSQLRKNTATEVKAFLYRAFDSVRSSLVVHGIALGALRSVKKNANDLYRGRV